MKIELAGRTALVTASTAGIGLAIAQGLAAAGARVILNGRSTDSVERARQRLLATVPGAEVIGVAADLSDAAGVDVLLAGLPKVDILVNNAGIFGPENFFETEDATWERYWQTNVMSGVRLSRALLPAMVDAGWGRVLFISSESARNIPADMIHYGVSKTAQLSLSRGLAKRVAGSGVTVNAVLPGPTLSDGFAAMFEDERQRSGKPLEQIGREFVMAHRPSSVIQRTATVEEVANMVVYLFLPFFVVQALGAFNDNVYRQAIISMLLFMAVPEEELGLYATLAPAIFILPYFLFSALAGQIADKLEKSRLIVITTTMEIVIMSLAATGFLTQSLPVLLVALFCTGMQSTLFGPVKYSVLPSVLKPEELTGGNGLVEMGTSMSILSGMIVGGLVFTVAGSHGTVVAACAIIALAICGNIAARLIPKVDAGDPNLKINWNPLPESLAVLRMARQQKAVRNSILGVSWFWFVGTVLTSQLPAYAVTNLGGEPTLYIFALALFSVGTGVGSLLCEKLSARTVESVWCRWVRSA